VRVAWDFRQGKSLVPEEYIVFDHDGWEHIIKKHLLKIKDIWEQLVAIGRNMKEDIVVIMPKNLPCAYEHFIENLNITITNVVLKFDRLCNKLLQ
jgi:hypothetical protein